PTPTRVPTSTKLPEALPPRPPMVPDGPPPTGTPMVPGLLAVTPELFRSAGVAGRVMGKFWESGVGSKGSHPYPGKSTSTQVWASVARTTKRCDLASYVPRSEEHTSELQSR